MRLWICSLLFYIFIFSLCELGRFQFSKFDKSKHNSILIILEFIGTIQICAPMFDVNIIIESYGMTGVFIEITFIEICNVIFLRDAFGDPCLLIGKFLNKKSWKWFSILLCTQFCAGLASFKLAKYWWSLKFHPIYNEMVNNESCESDLTVTLIYGMFIEAMGVISGKYIGHFLEIYVNDEIWNMFLNGIGSGIICVMGIQLTGMYANPIVAWACTFNCQGVSHFGHFMVYWIAPVFAHYVVGNFNEKEYDNKHINNEVNEVNEENVMKKNKNMNEKFKGGIMNKEESEDNFTKEKIVKNSSEENISLSERSIDSENNITFTIDVSESKEFSSENLIDQETAKENSKKIDESYIEEEDYEEEEIYEEEESSECSITQKYSTD